jgi:hypothetical protein
MQRVSKYAEAVSDGEMTLEEALQAVAIERHKGMITDGRNRYRACLEAGVEPWFEEYDGPPEKLAAHIRSRNEHRRDLTEEFREEQRRERIALAHEMREQGMSSRTIADKLGISRAQVRRYLDLQVGRGGPPEDQGSGEGGISRAQVRRYLDDLQVDTPCPPEDQATGEGVDSPPALQMRAGVPRGTTRPGGVTDTGRPP